MSSAGEGGAAMFSDIILDYYRHPRNFGSLPQPDAVVRDVNPLCGDMVEMQLSIASGKIQDIRFQGKGCAISQAAAGMLTELVQGKTLAEAHNLQKQELLDVLGVPLSAVRLKCALLSYKVFKMCVYQYEGMLPGKNFL